MAVELDHNGLSSIMPDMPPDQFAELVEDIRANGLTEKLQLDADGKLLDGRHREKACIAAGRQINTRPWRGPATPEAYIRYIASSNLWRRHLTPAQRADAARELIEIAKRLGAKMLKPTAATVADLADVSPSTAKRAVRRGSTERTERTERTPAAAPSRKTAASAGTPGKPTDQAGNVLPDELVDVFESSGFYRDCIRRLKAIEDAVVARCRAQDPSTAFVTIADLQSAISTARSVLKFAIPYVICPFCEGQACDRCNSAGWMPKQLYARSDVPDDLRYDAT